MLAQNMLQHKNYVTPQRDVRLVVRMSIAQANQAMTLILARWPELATMRSAGQLQSINSGGQFRIAAVRGGVLPADVTQTEVAHLVNTVLNQPELVDPAFDEQARQYARRR